MSAAVAETAGGKPIEVWFQSLPRTRSGDEARVGQPGTPTRVWAPRGTRPRAPRAPRDRRYTWTSLFGAVGPERDVGAAVVPGSSPGPALPKANAWARGQHLKEISHHVAGGAHAVVVLDQAGWHDTRCLDVPDNITLLAPPSDAPELNPVETIWQYPRHNFLSHLVYDDEQAIINACCAAWNKLLDLANKITDIANREWAKAVII